MKHTTALFPVLLALVSLPGCTDLLDDGSVSDAELLAAESNDADWLNHGRTYSEERFAPQDDVNVDTIGDLGLDWSFDLGVSRGIEATPIVHDGIMYVTATWNVVYALDARTGEKLWSFDPEVDRSRAAYLCCDAVNRGVAILGNSVFVGTIDGRLIAIDKTSGRSVWDVQTVDLDKPYSITGAPRVVDGNVIIGNGGGEFGVRGYVSAYDAQTGELSWRFHTVPGNPEDGFESAAMEMAAETWNGEWWNLGGGGTVWDSMAYDPELNLLYIGVGNGSPWNQELRSPGGGDNLFLSSIVALRPDTGEYVWHYQTTPGETWDFTATQHIILADLNIDGEVRKVLMQAPKNGFFYVIDRATGEFISGKNFVPVNWASHIDKETGRPVEVAEARWPGKEPYVTLPGPYGAHNWHPMSYSPQTNLVYIPAQEIPFVYAEDDNFTVKPTSWNTGAQLAMASLPTDAASFAAVKAMITGSLVAWDPVKQEVAWTFDHGAPWNGGVLSTAGNLVFQGTADAHFAAYNAATGERLWRYFTQTGIVAAPISYTVEGEQYIAIATGWGGVFGLTHGGVTELSTNSQVGRVLAFKLGGTQTLPEPEASEKFPLPDLSGISFPSAQVDAGRQLYNENCLACHGDRAMSSGLVPDVRRTAVLPSAEAWLAIVGDGGLAPNGMPGFGAFLSNEKIEAIRAYVAVQSKELAQASKE